MLSQFIKKFKIIKSNHRKVATSGSYEARQLAKVERMFKKVFEESKEKNTTNHENAVKYSFDDSLGIQLNDWLNGGGKPYGSYNGKYFKLGTTPDILVKHGAPDGEVIMYEDCLLKITGLKHSISLDELAKIPSQLNDPILLFKGSVDNSFVALTELKAKNGHDVIVAVHIHKQLGRTFVNKISSVYSKTDKYDNNKIVEYVTQQIENGNLLDASTKKAPIWFTASGLQLPHAVQTIIDANNSISPTEKNTTEFFHNSQLSNTNDTESTNLSLSSSDFLSPKTKNDITGKEFKVQEDISPAVNVNEDVDINSGNQISGEILKKETKSYYFFMPYNPLHTPENPEVLYFR